MISMRHIVVLAALVTSAAAPDAAWAQGPPPSIPPPLTPIERPFAQRRGQRPPIDERIRRAEERRGAEVTEPFSRTLTLGRNGTFELTNPSGDIVITGGRGDQLRIDAVKRARQQDEAEARRLLTAIEIDVAERTGLVQVRTLFPRARNWSGGVDYTVTLPDSASVVVRGVSGNVRVTNIGGDLRADTVSGDLAVTNVRRLRSVRAVSGDVEISQAEGQDTTAGTVSGSVTVRGLKAQGMTVESVSGDIRMSDAEIDRVRLRTVSGDVDFAGRLARGGRYEMESHSGDIRVQSDGGFDLEASTFSGGLQSNVQLRGETNDGGRGRPNRVLRGTRGDAGAILTLRTFSGDVTVSER